MAFNPERVKFSVTTKLSGKFLAGIEAIPCKADSPTNVDGWQLADCSNIFLVGVMYDELNI